MAHTLKPLQWSVLSAHCAGVSFSELSLSRASDPGIELTGFAGVEQACAHQITFLSNPKFRSALDSTHAAVVLMKPVDHAWWQTQAGYEQRHSAVCEVADPYLAFALLQQTWVRLSRPRPSPGIHASAVVEAGAHVHPSAHVGAHAYIAAQAVVECGAVIHAGVRIGEGSQIGEDSVLYPNAVVYDDCVIGKRAIVHAGAVIGADGFGFAPSQGTWVKIPQLGRVVIGDDVEIGANTTIDRGALEDTLIGVGVKLDNQIMIAHNVQVGDHTAMAGCSAVAGSTRIGARCTVGGAAMIMGHLSIPDGTHVSGASVVISTIKKPGAYTGIYPLDTHEDWEKSAAILKNIQALRKKVRELEKRISNT